MNSSSDATDSDAGSDTEVARGGRAAAILIGVAAHDLRTPLSAMSGWLQILRSSAELPVATRDRAFKGLQMAMAQQIALADGLATMAALQSGDLVAETGSVDMLAVINTAAAALQEEAGTRLVTLQAQAQEVDVRIESDANLAAMMVRHLLGAALKFAAKNSSLSIAANMTAGRGCEIRIDLAQSLLPGTGIETLLQYVRGLAGEKPGGAGAAFALSLTQYIAQVLGGSVHAGAGAGGQQVVLTARLPARPGGPLSA